MTKICVITGSRAEYGLFYPLLTELSATKGIKLQLVATGMHLSAKFGLTYRQIEADGFHLEAKVSFPLPDECDTAISIAKAIEGISPVIKRLAPDAVVLLGDRFETFAAAISAYTAQIPVAHIHGGEVTSGVFDEAFRHSITKMSSLHFATTEKYRKRIVQLGENPSSVFNVGAIGLDNIRQMDFLSRKDLEKQLGVRLGGEIACVTFHPAMFESFSPARQLKELFFALDKFPHLQIVFTLPNADIGASEIIRAIKGYAKKSPSRVSAFASLGQRRYLSLLKLSRLVLGNSSSGIIEAPSLRIPTVNIGLRQEGRVHPDSVITCPARATAISRAILKAISPAFRGCLNKTNPYGDGRTAARIVRILKQRASAMSVKKNFFDLSN